MHDSNVFISVTVRGRATIVMGGMWPIYADTLGPSGVPL